MKIITNQLINTLGTKDVFSIKAPILFRGALKTWSACNRWSPSYIADIAPNLEIVVKEYGNKVFNIKKVTLIEYKEYLDAFDAVSNKSVWYCHDIPLLSLLTKLTEDLQPFPTNMLPKYYHNNWHLYTQFFMGPKNSWTPLHFDCLLTNNLFFQIHGKKCFYFVDPKYTLQCEKYDWRWFRKNPLEFKSNGDIPYSKITVESGDLLYIPSGYLHAVQGLTTSISFNIDFHTRLSAIKSLLAVFKGMPAKNLYYNFLIFLGLCCYFPERYIYQLYRTYLNYIS